MATLAGRLAALAALLGLVLAGVLAAGGRGSAQVSGDWPQLVLTPLVSGLEYPVQLTNAGDGSGRLFILEQAGRVRIVRDGILRAQPFLDIADRVSCCAERGLLGIAFPP